MLRGARVGKALFQTHRSLHYTIYNSTIRSIMSGNNKPQQRLSHILSTLPGNSSSSSTSAAETRGEFLGDLKIGELTIPVYEALDKQRLPSHEVLLDWQARGGEDVDGAGLVSDGRLNDDLLWMCKKYLLGELFLSHSFFFFWRYKPLSF